MLSSSIQATLIGRYGESDYGKSKLAGEELFFTYGQETGAPVLVYRFPNLFGKWCRPNYNSAVATFCNNTANDLPITVNDRATELELLYIDDLVEEMLDALEGKPHRCDYDGLTPVFHDSGRYCAAPVTHKVTLGEIADLLERFKAQPATLVLPEIPASSFAKSCTRRICPICQEKVIFDLKRMRTPAAALPSCSNRELRPVQRQRLEARHHKGSALAQHEVGVFHRGFGPRSDSGAPRRQRRGAGI